MAANDLIIRIIDTNGNLQWYLEGEEASAATSSKESLAEKSWRHFDGDLKIFVPTTDVYLTKSKLPPMSQVKLLKMVPFAIEDEISTDVNTSHFAISSADSSGYTAVAVVSRECMDAWLKMIPADLYVHISLMTPDVFGLPWKENVLTVADLGQQVLVRLDIDNGFAIEKEIVIEILKQYQHEKIHHFTEVLLISAQAQSDLERSLEEHLKLPIIHQAMDANWAHFFAHHLDKKSALNLLQGEYELHSASRGVPRLKRIFTLMLVGWLVLMTAIGFVKYAILSVQAHRMNNELAMIYNEIFPGESSAINPKQRIESALKAVKKAKEQSLFLRLVSAASPVLIHQKGLSIQSANFSNSQLEVQLEASDFQLLDKVSADLRKKGLKAEQSRATKVGSVVQSHLMIKEG